jgi:hypothetical protein
LNSRPLCLIHRHSTIWATPPFLIGFRYFLYRVSGFCPGQASDRHPPTYPSHIAAVTVTHHHTSLFIEMNSNFLLGLTSNHHSISASCVAGGWDYRCAPPCPNLILLYGWILLNYVSITHFLYPHSFVDGHLNWFHSLATVNSARTIWCVCISVIFWLAFFGVCAQEWYRRIIW